MNKLLAVLILLLLQPIVSSFCLQEKPMRPVDYGSKVNFSIKNFGISVVGSFKGLEGNIIFDQNNLERSQIEASVDASTVNTGLDVRDKHLRGNDYFNVRDYQRIKFSSMSIERGAQRGNYLVKGILTIKSVSREIIIPFSVTSQEGGYLFSSSFSLNRRDYGIGGSSISLSDNLTVSLQILTKQ